MSDSEDEREKEKQWIKQYEFTQEQMTELKENFSMFDVEDEGVIAIDEIGNVLRAMGQSPTTQTIDAMKEEANADNNTVTLEEFVRLVGNNGGLKSDLDLQDELEDALKTFDKLGRGYIDAEELTQVLKQYGEPLDDDDIKELLKTGGVDPDGKVNYYDLINQLCAK